MPTVLTTDQASTEIGSCGTCDNLTTPLVKYLKTMPLDPSGGSEVNTGYFVAVDDNNIITITADSAENSVINVSR